jgi:hypothetical protein
VQRTRWRHGAILLFLSSCCGAVDFNVYEQQVSGSWLSQRMELGDETALRAATIGEEGQSVLAVDFFPPDCSRFLITIILSLGVVQSATGIVSALPTRLRIDDRPTHEFVMAVATEYGSDAVSLHIYAPEEQAAILKELMQGRSARFEFRIPGQTQVFYGRYPLDGSNAAITRAVGMCEATPRDEEARDEPPSDLEPEDDTPVYD